MREIRIEHPNFCHSVSRADKRKSEISLSVLCRIGVRLSGWCAHVLLFCDLAIFLRLLLMFSWSARNGHLKPQASGGFTELWQREDSRSTGTPCRCDDAFQFTDDLWTRPDPGSRQAVPWDQDHTQYSSPPPPHTHTRVHAHWTRDPGARAS